MIPLYKPLVTGRESLYIDDAIKTGKFSGDGIFTQRCREWLESTLECKKALLTTSCTHALEMAAMLLDISNGDEIIVPSFTFVSTGNAFVLHGAKLVFVDIRPDTMNLNEMLIEQAISEKTKAIIAVHYAGVSCEMDVIMKLANKYNLIVIEDAAHALMSKYKNQYLGTIGHLGCFSFHESKNYHCGEGGALLINDERFIERAEIIRDKGTNRKNYFRGEVDKYTWVDIGSSYLMSELNAAFLYPQLLIAEDINNDRLKSWETYYRALINLNLENKLTLPSIPRQVNHNAHIFYIKVPSKGIRSGLISYLQENGISTSFHYIPLHSSDMGEVHGVFNKEDIYTSIESERLLRLPMYYGLKQSDIFDIVSLIRDYFDKENSDEKSRRLLGKTEF
ncbi:dTDP-4-amino-4,6-dideoxygalactose transaminase [Metasolibacillus meyeri]|uniref:dTDP-4-amino-4,6-dideoxygalactose transaminase n=1 Tax=Metasolibacillus meyeri TaxID=1071052 RepID=UPI000D324700|nr:dTDP-4-amino-4,6-dideoxygalactose transaminase [Metasolibacillus meyeri]